MSLGRDGFDNLMLMYAEFPFKTGYITNFAPGAAIDGTLPPDQNAKSNLFFLTDAFREATDIHPNDVARVQLDFDYCNGSWARIKVWFRHPVDSAWARL